MISFDHNIKLVRNSDQVRVMLGDTLTTSNDDQFTLVAIDPPNKPFSNGIIYAVPYGQHDNCSTLPYSPTIFNLSWRPI